MKDYIYLGDRFTDPSLKNKECSAIRKVNGKCIRSKMGAMLVSFNGKPLLYRIRFSIKRLWAKVKLKNK